MSVGATFSSRAGSAEGAWDELITRQCSECAVLYAIPVRLREMGLEKGAGWYCPNGHFQSPVGMTTEQKLELAEDRATRERAARDQAEASARAHKGHATRVKNRVRAGLCPFGCNRHFKDLERHVKSKHPDERIEHDD